MTEPRKDVIGNGTPLFTLTTERKALCALCGKVSSWKSRGSHARVHLATGEAVQWYTDWGISKYEVAIPFVSLDA